ncbi:hypothetical protein TNCV_1269061 [Trichonephila clavipes]|nr:hypothetical protein TNCV_1269061 [Trichonephila clavipes]
MRKNKLNMKLISENQILSDRFIILNGDNLDMKLISKYQTRMSLQTIEKLSDKMDWNEIFEHQRNLTVDSILTHLEKQHPGLIFQQDKARPYTVRVAINCLTACQTLVSQIARTLSDRACLGYDGKATASNMTWSDNLRKMAKKYRRRPPGCIITLLRGLWQLASRLEMALLSALLCNYVTLK